jgi:hypothetical protein
MLADVGVLHTSSLAIAVASTTTTAYTWHRLIVTQVHLATVVVGGYIDVQSIRHDDIGIGVAAVEGRDKLMHFHTHLLL